MEFVKAMMKELDDHTVSQMPSNMKMTMAIWSFKYKHWPDGMLNKHKAQLCAHGGMQQWEVNYWETYAPVVNWMSV